jgi:hypothetical protein
MLRGAHAPHALQNLCQPCQLDKLDKPDAAFKVKVKRTERYMVGARSRGWWGHAAGDGGGTQQGTVGARSRGRCPDREWGHH